MKLSFKIFLGILIPSLLSIFIISSILVNKYMEVVLDFEVEKSYQEFKNTNSIINSSKYKDSELILFFDEIKSYFENKKIYFSYYKKNKLLY